MEGKTTAVKYYNVGSENTYHLFTKQEIIKQFIDADFGRLMTVSKWLYNRELIGDKWFSKKVHRLDSD